MIPIRVLVARMRRQTSKPSIPGSMMSSSATRISGLSRSFSSASRDYFGELKIVDVNIRRLRLKIEDNAQNPTFINTVWGYGYKWGF